MDPVLGYMRAAVTVRCMSDHSLEIKSVPSCAAQEIDTVETHFCRTISAFKRIIVSIFTKFSTCKLGVCDHVSADQDCVIKNSCHGA